VEDTLLVLSGDEDLVGVEGKNPVFDGRFEFRLELPPRCLPELAFMLDEAGCVQLTL